MCFIAICTSWGLRRQRPVSGNVYGLVAFGLPIVNTLLRLVTSTGVALRSAAPAPRSVVDQEPQP